MCVHSILEFLLSIHFKLHSFRSFFSVVCVAFLLLHAPHTPMQKWVVLFFLFFFFFLSYQVAECPFARENEQTLAKSSDQLTSINKTGNSYPPEGSKENWSHPPNARTSQQEDKLLSCWGSRLNCRFLQRPLAPFGLKELLRACQWMTWSLSCQRCIRGVQNPSPSPCSSLSPLSSSSSFPLSSSLWFLSSSPAWTKWVWTRAFSLFGRRPSSSWDNGGMTTEEASSMVLLSLFLLWITTEAITPRDDSRVFVSKEVQSLPTGATNDTGGTSSVAFFLFLLLCCECVFFSSSSTMTQLECEFHTARAAEAPKAAWGHPHQWWPIWVGLAMIVVVVWIFWLLLADSSSSCNRCRCYPEEEMVPRICQQLSFQWPPPVCIQMDVWSSNHNNWLEFHRWRIFLLLFSSCWRGKLLSSKVERAVTNGNSGRRERNNDHLHKTRSGRIMFMTDGGLFMISRVHRVDGASFWHHLTAVHLSRAKFLLLW